MVTWPSVVGQSIIEYVTQEVIHLPLDRKQRKVQEMNREDTAPGQ